jgi:hypothetical protein
MFTATIILVATILLPIIIALTITVILFQMDRRGRRTPLTADLLRGPGESLREDIDKISQKIDDYLLNLVSLCLPPLVLLQAFLYFGNNKLQPWQLVTALVLYVLLIYWGTSRLYQLLKQRRKLYLGLDAEMAVGQELNHLMIHGCRVFHDFYANGFNIDHVVIGPGGVIAVETKGRAKRDQGGGSADAKVIFNGEYLRFPHWLEKNPVIQARRQAVWLQKWLTSAVGQTVKVRPALAVAGWYVERTKNGDVLVFSGKNPVFLSNPNITGDRLSPEMIQRIVHQVELRCRNVEPSAYRKEKTKM